MVTGSGGGAASGASKTTLNPRAVIEQGFPGVDPQLFWPTNFTRLVGKSARFNEAPLLQQPDVTRTPELLLPALVIRLLILKDGGQEMRRFILWVEQPENGGLIAAVRRLNTKTAGLCARVAVLNELQRWAAEQLGGRRVNGWPFPRPNGVTAAACGLLLQKRSEGLMTEGAHPEMAQTLEGWAECLLSGGELSPRRLAQAFRQRGIRPPSFGMRRLAAAAFWRSLHPTLARRPDETQVCHAGITRLHAEAGRKALEYAYDRLPGQTSPPANAAGLPLLLGGIVECLLALPSAASYAGAAAAERAERLAELQAGRAELRARLRDGQLRCELQAVTLHTTGTLHRNMAEGGRKDSRRQINTFNGLAEVVEGALERTGLPDGQLVPLSLCAALRAPPDGLVGSQARLQAAAAAQAGLRGLSQDDVFAGCLATNMVVVPPLGGPYEALPEVLHLRDWLRQPAEAPDGTFTVRAFADIGRMPGQALADMCDACSSLLTLESEMLSRALREIAFGLVPGTLEHALAQQLASPEWPCWEQTPFSSAFRCLLAKGQAAHRAFIAEAVTGRVLRAPLDSLPSAAERAGLAAENARLVQVAAAAYASAAREGVAADETTVEFLVPQPAFSAAEEAAIAVVAADLDVQQAAAPQPPTTPFVQSIGLLFDACVHTVAVAGGLPDEAVAADLASTAVIWTQDGEEGGRSFDVLLRTSPQKGATPADFASFAIQEDESVRELFLNGLPAIPGVAMGATTLAQLAVYYAPGAGSPYVVRVWRADCQPSMGYFTQRIHVLDGGGGAGITGAQLLHGVLDASAALPGNIAYVIVPESSRITCCDINVVLRDCDDRLRWVFADLHAAAAAGVGYLPPGLLVAGTWLNIRSQVARAIFCLHLWAGHLLPRILVRLQQTVGQWA